jgi:hypothetical protein
MTLTGQGQGIYEKISGGRFGERPFMFDETKNLFS